MTTATSPPPLQTGSHAPAAGPATGASELGTPAPAAPREGCPLCGAPLDPQQEWCLRCGAAARTRLAASPNWKGPVAALAVVGILALGALAAALVKLAGDSGPAPPAKTVLVTVPAAAATPSTPTTPGTTVPGTTIPGTTV